MSLTVKAYLYKKELGNLEGAEIRRFVIDQDVASNFEYFSKKLIQLFPSLSQDKFEVYWRDDEGDFVAFSSDDELTQALGLLNEQVFRVHLTAHIQTKDGDAPQGEAHPNVICDACDQGVVGIRFKCLVCPDYDLCSGCANKGLHSDHEMLRLCKPATWPFCGPPPPGGPWGPHHGPGPHPHGPPPHGPWGPGAGPQHWGRWMRRCMKQMWRGMQGAEGEEGQQQKEGADAAMKDGSTVDQSADEKKKVQDEYLRAVGENIAAMLDPMGIDVMVDVENQDGARFRCSPAQQATNPQGAPCGPGRREFMRQMRANGQFPGHGFKCGGGGGGRGKGKCGGGGGGRGCPGKKDKGDKEKLMNETETMADEEVVEIEVEKPVTPKPAESASKDVPMEEVTDGEPSPSKATGSEGEGDWTVVNSEVPAEGERARQPYQFSFINKDGAKETVPSQIEPPSDRASQSASQGNSTQNASAGIYPTIPQPEVVHPNPRIAEALRQMTGMGFNNDGGWLTHLLEQKDGDIGRVLDTLQPARRN